METVALELRDRVGGRVELSPSFPGYVKGVIVAGRSAADCILASLAAR